MKPSPDTAYCKVPAECLRSGDVILSSSASWQSLGIKTATWTSGNEKAFSHAALLISPPPVSREDLKLPKDYPKPLVSLFEADGHGVGYTNLYATNYARSAGAEVVLPYAAGTLAIYRHPDLDALGAARIDEAAQKLVACYHADKYSVLIRLVDTVSLPPGLKGMAKLIAKLTSRPLLYPGDEGVFCSELVAHFFDLVGLPLFAIPHDSTAISPSHLASPRSYLKQVPCNPEPYVPEAWEDTWEINRLNREVALPIQVDSKSIIRTLQHIENLLMEPVQQALQQLKGSLEATESYAQSGLDSMRTIAKEVNAQLQQLFEIIGPLSEPDSAEWVRYERMLEGLVREHQAYTAAALGQGQAYVEQTTQQAREMLEEKPFESIQLMLALNEAGCVFTLLPILHVIGLKRAKKKMPLSAYAPNELIENFREEGRSESAKLIEQYRHVRSEQKRLLASTREELLAYGKHHPEALTSALHVSWQADPWRRTAWI